jgi:hypothetical protein
MATEKMTGLRKGCINRFIGSVKTRNIVNENADSTLNPSILEASAAKRVGAKIFCQKMTTATDIKIGLRTWRFNFILFLPGDSF